MAAPSTEFGRALRAHASSPKGRKWVYVPYDQLSAELGPLRTMPPKELGIVLIETTWKPAQRPYHKQKLALILANMRHFALEQARRGVAVRYVSSTESYGAVLQQLREELGPIACMRPAERELHVDIHNHVEMLPHEGWLSTYADFETLGEAPWRMDGFYRHMRRKTGILMDKGKPRGGKWSLDAENRQRWRGEPAAPTPPSFTPDAITREVGQLVEESLCQAPGHSGFEPAAQPPRRMRRPSGRGRRPSVCRTLAPTKTPWRSPAAACFIPASPCCSTCTACCRPAWCTTLCSWICRCPALRALCVRS